ncbi:uncharacterized protein LOC135134627 [Zophobas morio]|uniref:uncharacterized protein LOC135134627 n=1 Tax=Zophobas morio TaxID=2755281 RepID=UPI0030838050
MGTQNTTKDIWRYKKLDQWRRRTNREIEEIYGEPTITKIIRARRLRWLGHVGRAPEERTIGKVLDRLKGGKKKRGRPKLKWIDDVRKDLQNLGIEDWRSKAADRNKWKIIVKKAQGL